VLPLCPLFPLFSFFHHTLVSSSSLLTLLSLAYLSSLPSLQSLRLVLPLPFLLWALRLRFLLTQRRSALPSNIYIIIALSTSQVVYMSAFVHACLSALPHPPDPPPTSSYPSSSHLPTIRCFHFLVTHVTPLLLICFVIICLLLHLHQIMSVHVASPLPCRLNIVHGHPRRGFHLRA
jgi:hypothetical protein